jgi:hypothetical protein
MRLEKERREEEKVFFSDISMKAFLKRERRAAINQLYALYEQAGIIDITKKDLQDSAGRKARHGELPPELAGYADIYEEQLDLFEEQLEEGAGHL